MFELDLTLTLGPMRLRWLMTPRTASGPVEADDTTTTTTLAFGFAPEAPDYEVES